jgi:hypothetical protein
MALSSCGCVARGTLVSTPRGPRRVEELQVGDEVVVVDPASRATARSPLLAIRVARRECGTVRHAGGALCVTTDHPLYDPDADAFYPAGDWLLGSRRAVLVHTDGRVEREVLTEVETFTRVDDVFDLTVAHEWHTFVADGVVVHNKTPPCRDPAPNTACTCMVGGVAGSGVLACESNWSTPVCVQCTITRPADAGPGDGGAGDGGTDAGP